MQEPNSSIVRVSIDTQITLTAAWRGKGVSDPVSVLQRRLGDGGTSVHSRTSFLQFSSPPCPPSLCLNNPQMLPWAQEYG